VCCCYRVCCWITGCVVALQGVAEAECRRAADAAEAAYCAAFRESATAPEEAALQGEHRRACEAASAAYTSAAIGEPSVRPLPRCSLHSDCR
jgi:hypothetical protein